MHTMRHKGKQGYVGGGLFSGGGDRERRAPGLYEGKDGTLCYDGSAENYAEWEDRTRLRHEGTLGMGGATDAEANRTKNMARRSLLSKLRQGFQGRAHEKTKDKEEISAKS